MTQRCGQKCLDRIHSLNSSPPSVVSQLSRCIRSLCHLVLSAQVFIFSVLECIISIIRCRVKHVLYIRYIVPFYLQSLPNVHFSSFLPNDNQFLLRRKADAYHIGRPSWRLPDRPRPASPGSWRPLQLRQHADCSVPPC